MNDNSCTCNRRVGTLHEPTCLYVRSLYGDTLPRNQPAIVVSPFVQRALDRRLPAKVVS